VAFAEKASDVFAQYPNFEKSEAAAKIDERTLRRMPDGCRKVQYELLKAGRDNSTLTGQSRTVHFKTEK
jgi:hypothetical protein